MKQFLRSCFLLIVACAGSAVGLHAQTVLYSTDFADAQGWTFTASAPPVEWAVDDTPANVLTSLAWHSAPYSLNYNNGVNYFSGLSSNIGTATSPPIDLSAASGSVSLGFWCNWSTEDGPCAYDTRGLLISNDGFQTTTYAFACFTSTQCGQAGQWHFHSVPLDPQWGLIQVRFTFDTSDQGLNDFEGWFIDDLLVITGCLGGTTYCQPKQNSQGCLPTIFATGTPSLSGAGPEFRIWANNELNQRIGLMIWGRTALQYPMHGGILCIAPPVARTAPQNSGGTAWPAVDCSGTYVFQFTPAMMNQAGFLVGDDVYSQYWSRDNGFPPPDNVGLTAGVHWEVCP